MLKIHLLHFNNYLNKKVRLQLNDLVLTFASVFVKFKHSSSLYFVLNTPIAISIDRQECIPVGCVPPAAMVIFRWFKFTLKPPYSIAIGKL